MNHFATPNQSASYDRPEDAWKYALGVINRFGNQVITENGQMTREIRNLLLTVRRPCDVENWPIEGSGWNMAGLEKYAEQMMSAINPGFDYTYGNRLRSYVSYDSAGNLRTIDQLENVIEQIKKNPTTRRGVAITWYPGDTYRNFSPDLHVPCMIMLDFLSRGDRIHLSAVFRSHDIQQAWPANVYGLSRILWFVANGTGKMTGHLTTFSVSAHVYRS